MPASLAALHAPVLKTPLPGPKAQTLIAQDQRATSTSYTRYYPLVVARGAGAILEDVDGNLFLDFTAGIAVCSTGHCHPRIVAALQRQAESLIHFCGADFYYPPLAELAQKLTELAPGPGPKRAFFTNSGTESIEAALKLARYHTGRQHLIAFYGAFHGRTMGALSLTGSKVTQRKRFAPLVPGVTHIEYSLAGLDLLEEVVLRKTVAPDEVAAIVVEPIQGEGGYLIPHPEFLPRLRALTKRHGMLLIADEVQSGMGRTGKMFAVEHEQVVPDILCLAKGIASGMPLGAIVAPANIMSWAPGAHANTFGGNPLSCVAALETIALLEEGLLAHTASVGALLKSLLQKMTEGQALLGDVRGRGLMIGLDIQAGSTGKTAAEVREAILQKCFSKGLVLLGCGERTIRFCPPLVISPAQAQTAVTILSEAVRDVEQELSAAARCV